MAELPPPRKIIQMPRSRYVDSHGLPVHPVYGPWKYWPRELQDEFNNYSRYLDRLWSWGGWKRSRKGNAR
jgi:hypothetical protein